MTEVSAWFPTNTISYIGGKRLETNEFIRGNYFDQLWGRVSGRPWPVEARDHRVHSSFIIQFQKSVLELHLKKQSTKTHTFTHTSPQLRSASCVKRMKQRMSERIKMYGRRPWVKEKLRQVRPGARDANGNGKGSGSGEGTGTMLFLFVRGRVRRVDEFFIKK